MSWTSNGPGGGRDLGPQPGRFKRCPALPCPALPCPAVPCLALPCPAATHQVCIGCCSHRWGLARQPLRAHLHLHLHLPADLRRLVTRGPQVLRHLLGPREGGCSFRRAPVLVRVPGPRAPRPQIEGVQQQRLPMWVVQTAQGRRVGAGQDCTDVAGPAPEGLLRREFFVPKRSGGSGL